jgi:succinate dehydrogenase/fumarate reductase-like Fe-S protein
MEHYTMNLTLKVWRQKNKDDRGGFETYKVKNISSEMSFLEMFDVLNEELIREGKEPIAFDHDCREGICGTCSMYINGWALACEYDLSATHARIQGRRYDRCRTLEGECFSGNKGPGG